MAKRQSSLGGAKRAPRTGRAADFTRQAVGEREPVDFPRLRLLRRRCSASSWRRLMRCSRPIQRPDAAAEPQFSDRLQACRRN